MCKKCVKICIRNGELVEVDVEVDVGAHVSTPAPSQNSELEGEKQGRPQNTTMAPWLLVGKISKNDWMVSIGVKKLFG